MKMTKASPAEMQKMRKAMPVSWPTNYFGFWARNPGAINDLLRFQSWLLTRWETRSPEHHFDLGAFGFTDPLRRHFSPTKNDAA
jgi:hypothetical protein